MLDADGNQIKWGNACLTKIEFAPIVPNEPISAVLHLSLVNLDLTVSAEEVVSAWPPRG